MVVKILAPIAPPAPASAKVSCQGVNKLENIFLMILYDFVVKSQKNNLPGGLKRGPREKYNRRFSEGSKKRKTNNNDKLDHGQKKRRPSTLCLGKKC